MSEQLSTELEPFKTIILSLASYAMHPKLDILIEKLTPAQKPSIRFLIKVEIKRLSRPCPYVLDFRSYFAECEPVQYQNICHYLDKISKILFLDSVEKNNGLFTMNIYNEINIQAKKRHLKAVEQHKLTKHNYQIKTESVKSFQLVNDNICYDKQLNIFPRCKVFTYDPLGMSRKGKEEIGHSVTLLDVNPQNCVIKAPIETINYQDKIIYLWFYDHDKQLNYHQDIVLQYSIEDFKEVQSSPFTHYRLKLNTVSSSIMVGYLADLLHRINRIAGELLVNQVQPLIDSVYAKSHEQFVLNSSQDIAMVCAPYKTGWRPTAGLQTRSNQALWNFFSTEGNNDPIARLFCNPSLQSALDNQHKFDQYAYVLRHHYQENGDDKDQFIIIWQQQLIHDIAAQNYLIKNVLNGNYRYVRFSFTPIDVLSDAYNPSAVPSYVSPAMALLNRTLGKQVSEKLKKNSYLAVLSDVTEINTVLSLSKVLNIKDKLQSTDTALKCPTSFLLPLLQRKSPMEIVKVKENDVRAEDRFDVETPITITRCGNKPCTIHGFSENISTHGLSIKLSKPLQYRAGDEIQLSITMPYKNKIVTLPKQKYQLIGGKDRLNLRLVISTLESRHAASWMFRDYIYP